MKQFKKLLRFWLTVVSVGGFLTGWVILANNPRNSSLRSQPGQSVNVELQPVPQLNQLVDGSNSSNGAGQPFAFSRPSRGFRFRTGGS